MKFFAVLIPLFAALTLATPTPISGGPASLISERQQPACRSEGAICSTDEQCCGNMECGGLFFLGRCEEDE
ncbi:unnamed protein product [Rhizoctonia solani]|uniref:Uncharacterized protein n=1 Tax=Rhizoctonia solani TaxID=456999 RepID=A0A8H3DYI0_9AGAM|nr:unnamed protein product [Rhizoctonia solani]